MNGVWTKERILFIAALLGTVVMGTVAWVFRHPEPVYQGRRLSSWLRDVPRGRVLFFTPGSVSFGDDSQVMWIEQFDPGRSQAFHEQAKEAVQKIGTNAWPRLLRELRTRDSSMKESALRRLTSLKIVKLRWISGRERRERAASALNCFGSPAIIPALIQILEDDGAPVDARTFAAHALQVCGSQAEPAFPALSRAAQSHDADLRRVAQATLDSLRRRTINPSYFNTR